MNLNTLTDLIIEKFQSSLRIQLIEQINFIIRQGSTGGEIAAGMGRFLLDLEKENPEAFKEIEDFIHAYINECAKYDLFFE